MGTPSSLTIFYHTDTGNPRVPVSKADSDGTGKTLPGRGAGPRPPPVVGGPRSGRGREEGRGDLSLQKLLRVSSSFLHPALGTFLESEQVRVKVLAVGRGTNRAETPYEDLS